MFTCHFSIKNPRLNSLTELLIVSTIVFAIHTRRNNLKRRQEVLSSLPRQQISSEKVFVFQVIFATVKFY